MIGSSTFVAADGDGYELQMERWSQRLARLFLEFVGTAPGECVLDVGCGTVRLTFALTEQCQGKELHDIDLSPAYIAHARRHTQHPKLVFQVGDACALDFPNHRFDRVLSLLMLHFVPRADQAIAEMQRVARPGAVVGAAV
jgi:ubiquinone/menaquinone biosynthesis C-methylase UbiE